MITWSIQDSRFCILVSVFSDIFILAFVCLEAHETELSFDSREWKRVKISGIDSINFALDIVNRFIMTIFDKVQNHKYQTQCLQICFEKYFHVYVCNKYCLACIFFMIRLKLWENNILFKLSGGQC